MLSAVLVFAVSSSQAAAAEDVSTVVERCKQLHSQACEQLPQPALADVACSNSNHEHPLSGEHALKYITDQSQLLRVARDALHPEVRGMAIQKLDLSSLFAFACRKPIDRAMANSMTADQVTQRLAKCDKRLAPVIWINSSAVRDGTVEQAPLREGKKARIMPGTHTVSAAYHDSAAVPGAYVTRDRPQEAWTGGRQSATFVAHWASNCQVTGEVTPSASRDTPSGYTPGGSIFKSVGTWGLRVKCSPIYPSECEKYSFSKCGR